MDIDNSVVIALSPTQARIKRVFDVFFSVLGLSFSFWLIILAWFAASFDTRSNGFFFQIRVGKDGQLFRVVKIKTMMPTSNINTTVTRLGDPRITPLGEFFRRTKIDELPQLWNVLCGDMSFVGPRPDVPGFADCLKGFERAVLAIRPGITGPATLCYRNEEELLAKQVNPEEFNRLVIWPDKVKINLDYILNWSLTNDIKIILQTVIK